MLKVAVILVFVYIFSLAESVIKNDSTAMSKGDPQSMSRDLMTSGSDQDDMTGKDMMPDLMGIMNKCNDTFRTEMAYLEALNESGSFPDETDKTPKCFVRCVLEGTGVAAEDGQFNAIMAGMVFSGQKQGKKVEDIQNMATMCGDHRMESDQCLRSYMFMKCLMESEIKGSMKIM